MDYRRKGEYRSREVSRGEGNTEEKGNIGEGNTGEGKGIQDKRFEYLRRVGSTGEGKRIQKKGRE